MNFADLNKLDFRTVADWPITAKLGLLGMLFAMVVAAGWWFLWSPSLESLEASKAREEELRSTYASKKGQAINLEAYEKQLADIQQSFGALLKQLPNRQEMDALITDVNQAGLGRGLQFELFRPGAESKREFYAELPISIKVTGSYHDIGAFTSDVAQLSRIVTIHNIKLVPTKSGVLVMEAVAKTYRYLDEEEIAASKPQKKKGGKK